jgi:MarR family transcriptional regulator, lower aerobic nicotinate degradation pathway regulator
MTPPEYPAAENGKTENYHFTEQVGHLLRKVYQRHVAIFQQNVAIRN